MELKLTKESICINEVVFDGTLEQSIELDYLLPDYCPSIFKVLKSKVMPKITSERIMNGKLLIDGIAYIKIMYVCEENYRIRSITQKQAFSKSMELKENYEPLLILTALAIRLESKGPIIYTSKPVSYTHLDVYKRQSISPSSSITTVRIRSGSSKSNASCPDGKTAV